MISDGKSFYSVSGINNNFSYSLLNNLTLNGNVGLFIMQSPLQNQNPLIEQLSIATMHQSHINHLKILFCNFEFKRSRIKKTTLHFTKG